MCTRCEPRSAAVACQVMPAGSLILLDEVDAAIAVLPEALLRGDVTGENLRIWPLFDGLRGMPDFDRLVRAAP